MKKAEEILEAVAEASGIDKKHFKSVARTGDIANARGVYFLLCRKYGVKSRLASRLVSRNTSVARQTFKRYQELLDVSDKKVVTLLEKTQGILSEKG